MNLEGAVLARRFRLGKPLGAGAMGGVYEAERVDGSPSGPLALKILHLELVGDADVAARFADEGRAAMRLVHPNIVRVFEVGVAEDGRPFVVMERLEGTPLGVYTKRGGRVPVEQTLAIMQGVLAGLAAAHAQGIVHRDLKPENVFLARGESGSVTPKILDFGIAKVMDAAGGMGQKTRTGMLLGTPGYMSPEQIRNARDVDARADLWSAGVMIYEMLTGRVAFAAPTEYARLSAVLNIEPAPLAEIDPSLARLAPVVAQALRKAREQRFSSALEMARALAQAAGFADASGAALSRMPEVASLLVPMVSSVGQLAPGSSHPPTLPPSIEHAAAIPIGPGGTLASAPSRKVSEAPPQILIVPSTSGTLPSHDLPMFAAVGAGGGVLPRVRYLRFALFVAALVLLAVGFGAGYIVGQLR